MCKKCFFLFSGSRTVKSKNIFLTLILSIFLSGCTDYTQIHGRYVDYNCEPISGEKFTLHGSHKSWYQLIHSTQYNNTVTTDKDGYFSGYAKGDHRTISVYPNANQRDFINIRRFDKVEISEILKDNIKDDSLIFYREPDNKKIRTRRHDQRMITLHEGIRDVRWLQLPIFNGSNGWRSDDFWLRWGYIPLNGRSKPVLELSTVRGGLYEVDRSDLPFKSRFPVSGYNGAVRIDLDKEPSKHFKRAYYMKTRGDTTYGTLILDIVKRSKNQYSVNMVVDSISNRNKGNRFTERLVLSVHEGSGVERSRTPINKLDSINMPPVTCGGILDYDHDGYYVNYPYDPKLKKDEDQRLNYVHGEIANRETVLEETVLLDDINIDDFSTILAILDDQRVNQETIRRIYQYYVEKGRWQTNIFDKLASLKNTPDDILLELIDTTRENDSSYLTYGVLISSRRNLSSQVINKILSKGKYWAKNTLANNPDTNSDVLLRLVNDGIFPSLEKGDLSNLTAEILEKITEALVSPKNRADEKVLAIIAWAKKANAETLSSIFSYNEQQRSPKYEIRHNLAHNPSTPVKILGKLSQFNDIHVRTGVYCNSNTTKEVSLALKDKDLLQCTPYGIHQLLAVR